MKGPSCQLQLDANSSAVAPKTANVRSQRTADTSNTPKTRFLDHGPTRIEQVTATRAADVGDMGAIQQR
ncbi:hypothetical protein GCM10009641_80280 [Mycobacterium cookii]|uniref:Uncharacterized protein n=1 Tax=Mycobacterium cookii TaxID=1775 RepID=A0A7I7KWF9_9MYCO|nr:hypothetical protein MCOO_21110 [Mycobacterium cookii]